MSNPRVNSMRVPKIGKNLKGRKRKRLRLLVPAWEEKCYVHNIFTINHKWLVVIDSNLNLILRLLFCPNNNDQ